MKLWDYLTALLWGAGLFVAVYLIYALVVLSGVR